MRSQIGHDLPTKTSAARSDLDERRAHVHGMWSAVAHSWAAHADYTDERHVAETTAMLSLTAPKRGDRVLELACAAGGTGLAAAPLAAPGEVVLSDVAAEMTLIASDRIRARGVTNATVRVLDLESIAEDDAAFDVVLCRHGLQFTVDPARAISEIARILRPGGRVAVSVWGPREDNPWLALVLDTVSAHIGKPVPPPGMPGPFSLSDADVVAGLLSAAGLRGVQGTEISVPSIANGFEQWWTRTSGLAGPLSAALARMGDESIAVLRDRAREAIASYRTPSGYEFPGLALVVSGRR